MPRRMRQAFNHEPSGSYWWIPTEDSKDSKRVIVGGVTVVLTVQGLQAFG